MDVSVKISNAIDGIKGEIGNPDKLRVKFSKPMVPVYIRADKTRIYQVIANLINNAIKFTKERFQ